MTNYAGSFPIAQFQDITPAELTIGVNQLIIEINQALVASGGGSGATGYCTRRQLLAALNLQGQLGTVASGVGGLPVTNTAWIEYNTALCCSQTGPLATYIASLLSYDVNHMNTLWALAQTQAP